MKKEKEDTTSEIWREVKPDFDYGNPMKLYVSNLGNVKTTTRITADRAIRPGTIGGYKAIYLRYFKPRTTGEQQELIDLKRRFKDAKIEWRNAVKARILEKRQPDDFEKELQIKTIKAEQAYKKVKKADEKSRVFLATFYVHQMVAEYFVEKPSEDCNNVIHIDHNILNNHFSNLKWVKSDEVAAHTLEQEKVVKEHRANKKRLRETTAQTELSPYKIKKIKALLQEGATISELSKKYKTTASVIKKLM